MRGGVTSPLAPPSRSVFGVAIVTLLPLAALTGFAVLSALSAFRAADEARLDTAARALATSVDAKLGAVLASLRVLATSPALDAGAMANTALDRLHAVNAELGGKIVLLGPPMDQTASTTSNGPDANMLPSGLATETALALALREPLGRVFASGQPVVSDLVAGAGDAPPFLAAIVPVTRGGEVRSALAVILDPDTLQVLLVQQGLPDGTRAGIGDSRLRVLAYSGEQGRYAKGSAAPDWMALAIEGRSHAIAIGPGSDGLDSIYALIRPKLAPGWTVGVGQSLDLQRVAAWRAVQWMLAGGTALGLGLAAAVWVSRRRALCDARRQAHLLGVGRAEVLRLLGGMPAVIFHRELWRDGSSRLLYRGGDFEDVTGWPATAMTREDALRQNAYPGDTRLADMAEALWRDGQVRYQWRMLQPDGGVRWLSTLARVINRHGDDRMEVVGYSTNITAEHEAKARALSAARLASLGEMAAGLAHELKQPLQSMTLAADIAMLAAARKDHTEIVRRLETIIGQAQRAGDLIERVRRSARGSVNTGAAEDVQLAAAVEGALLLTGSTLANAGVTVDVALGEPTPVVCAEAVSLEQVLSNLLLNAADALALQPADVARRVRIAAERSADGMVRISIADTGGGIAAEVFERIFQPFVTTKGPDKGTGLGLSICHGLITGMGGRIEARNEAAGAVFTVTLAEADARSKA